ncbi:MAG: DNA sulfur modification protein DndE [Oscillospiraceae bacterium]|nr:DNA sulfur modification protein DndE [Oscillospiraceae bacterium]
MIIKQIKLSQKDKERLIRLKSKTGIANWNVLCRWALCFSLSEPTMPAPEGVAADSNLEMSWMVFGGEYQEIYTALIKQRCIHDGLNTERETLQQQFRLHLHRGISYLSATNYIRNIDELILRASEKIRR